MRPQRAAGRWPDEQLVRECLAGNNAGWDALIDKYKRLVYSVAARYQLPPEDAADVFQQVWLDLYRDLPRLERVESLASWLITATARRCLLCKKRRQKARQLAGPERDIEDESPNASEIQAGAERAQGLRDAIGMLAPRCRRLVEMLFFEDPPRPYAEAARSLGLAEGSIGFIRGRCLQKLREALRQMGV